MPTFRIRVVDMLVRHAYVDVKAEEYEHARTQVQQKIHDAYGSLTELENLLDATLHECGHTITIGDIVKIVEE